MVQVDNDLAWSAWARVPAGRDLKPTLVSAVPCGVIESPSSSVGDGGSEYFSWNFRTAEFPGSQVGVFGASPSLGGASAGGLPGGCFLVALAVDIASDFPPMSGRGKHLFLRSLAALGRI